MGSLFRSEDMRLCQIFLQTEAAYACVSELGELGLVQFKDLNDQVNAFQRKFVNEVRRCEEMERKLRFTEKEILKEKLVIENLGENPKAPFPKEMVDLEVTFEKMEHELQEVNTNNEQLKRNYTELLELKEVLMKSQFFFSEHHSELHHMMEEAQHALPPEEAVAVQRGTAQLQFVAGVIPRERVGGFELALYRVCRGNTFLRQEMIEESVGDPDDGDVVLKNVFIVFFQGEQLKGKVKKICEAFRASLYPVPNNLNERDQMLNGVLTRIHDLRNVIAQTNSHRLRVLQSAQKEIRSWIIKVEKIKAIYHTLNMFKVSQNSLIAECWCPTRALDNVRMALSAGEKISGSTIPSILQPMTTEETPPTFFQINKFTRGFQNIVEAYGVATYGEVNPVPFTCITFPFLFAVMFGDAGHGLIMMLFGLWMCVRERSLAAQRSSNEIWLTFFNGRYIITMMGLFSIYTGLVYNDAFAKPLNIFGTEWVPDYDLGTIRDHDDLQLNAATMHPNGTAYFFGIDPIWQISENKILFLNSLKMKMAVILGVLQMMFGICLSVFNHWQFDHKPYILMQFVPELGFLTCLLGYLVFLIYYKWLVFDGASSKCAPPLLIHYINMFMFKYTETKEGEECAPEDIFYDGQKSVQTTVLVLALACVPALLLAKPIYQIVTHKMKYKILRGQSTQALLTSEVLPNSDVGNHTVHADDEAVPVANNLIEVVVPDPGDKLDIGEIFIYQILHTIEFCLSCISHTASYLRLWALSLAHAQLSEVLWSMVLSLGLKMDSYVGAGGTFVLFFAWANLTVAILLLMEGLSAFLHTLRLHWIEFNSKFYKGEGYSFVPFSFKEILEMQSLQESS